jgi:predicted phage tail protein
VHEDVPDVARALGHGDDVGGLAAGLVEADGVYTFGVRQRDEAGNTGATATSPFALDRSVPDQPAIDAAPGVTGSSHNASWSFSGEADSTFECRLERGAGVVIDDWTSCTSPRDYNLAGEPDGAYTFLVRARNPLGTPSAARNDVYTLDTAAPAAPAIATDPGARGSSRTPAWSFTGEAGASFECRLETGTGTAVNDWSTCSSPKSYALAGLSDGAYVFKVHAHDGAGNTSTNGSHTYVLDTTAPAAPDLTSAPASPGQSRAPVWKWSGEAGASFECRMSRGSAVVSDWAACLTGQAFDLSGRPDGTYTLQVRALDAAGNAGAVRAGASDLDTTPGALQIRSGPAPVARDRQPSWSFSGEPGAVFACRLQAGSDVVANWSGCSTPHAYDLGAAPDGDYLFTVRATDAAGNMTPGVAWPFRLDTIAPPKPVIDARPPQRDRDRSPEWSFSHEAGAAFECRVEHGSSLVFDWQPCTTPLKVDLRGQEDGVYVLSARALDPAGNVGEPVSTTYRLDTTDPDAPEISSRPGRSGEDRKPRWAWRGESGATFTCRLRRGSDTIKDWRACESPQAYDLGGEKTGTYAFSVRASDTAGNTGTAASDEYELRAAATPTSTGSGGDSGSGGSGGGDAGSGGAGGAAPAAAPAASPAAPGAAPPADNPAADDAGDDEAGGGDGAKGKDAGARAGAGAGAGPGAKGAAQGGAAGAGGAGAAGGDGEDGGGRKKKNKSFAKDPLGAAGESVAKVAAAIAKEPAKTAFPMSLIFVIAGFMGLQGRIDRNDPKLALAPVFADPDLEFRPPSDALAAMEE